MTEEKTNLEHFIESLTEEDVALILTSEYSIYNNRCVTCAYMKEKICRSSMCKEGTIKWLRQSYNK